MDYLVRMDQSPVRRPCARTGKYRFVGVQRDVLPSGRRRTTAKFLRVEGKNRVHMHTIYFAPARNVVMTWDEAEITRMKEVEERKEREREFLEQRKFAVTELTHLGLEQNHHFMVHRPNTLLPGVVSITFEGVEKLACAITTGVYELFRELDP
jgi:hypothetical protein